MAKPAGSRPEVARPDASQTDAGHHATAVERKRVLFACLDPSEADHFEPAFSRMEFELHRVAAMRHATKLASYVRFDLMIVGYRGEAALLEELFTAIRSPGAPNASTRVALVSAPEDLVRARLLGARWSVKALDASLGQLDLQEAALTLLRSRARLAVRVLARISVRLGADAATQLLCQTRDLSRTGLFLTTQSRFPVGASVIFTLDLPDGGAGIRGEAEIVRHVAERRELGDGFGLRFLHFAADGERRLATFLERRLH